MLKPKASPVSFFYAPCLIRPSVHAIDCPETGMHLVANADFDPRHVSHQSRNSTLSQTAKMARAQTAIDTRKGVLRKGGVLPVPAVLGGLNA